MDEHKAQVGVREVQGIELGAKRVPLLLVGEYLYSHPPKLAIGGEIPQSLCSAGLTGGMWPVRPCYSATARKLAVEVLSEGPNGLAGGWSDRACAAGQTGLMHRSDRLLAAGQTGKGTPVRPPRCGRSDRPWSGRAQ
uniref:Uncharacterized protein n=1 Tax=Oryza sativa subsp. japonica TaxID=39947 RepID=Q94GK2_ORYSJ|nr:hypothetical protein [Oryza sativa Japonica Group]